MRQSKAASIRGCFISGLLLLSACSSSDSTTGQLTGQPTGQEVTHTTLNGTWETGCIVDAGTSLTVSDVYLNGARTTEKVFYSDVLCSTISSMETTNANYILGTDIAIDVSVTGLSTATSIEFEPDNSSSPAPFFDLIAIKVDTITELYTGDLSSPATDGSSPAKKPVQLKALSSAIKHENLAEVVSVETSGTERNYTITVGVLSPDTGCNQYADWWEIVSESGELIYRRVLRHSHIDEQPFARAGEESVDISNNQIVIIRAHMNAHASDDNSGYGIKTYKGSINNGFAAFETAQNFAADLATQAPLPLSCLF
ncbi:hypothetical protein MNBD_GAMMA11-163 [hydrothermal vent metagenome]|uniref:Lipoprotein n=1 Tax=hydrothermal vent metagenome TaxID=652676 RepID=A0A3B0WSQ3_9ZZZZ